MNTTEPVTKDFGPTDEKITVTMTSVTDHEGIYITTVAGGGHNSTLSRNFPHAEIASARIFYGHIKDAAKAGKAVYQIEAEISALIEAIEATSRTGDEIADALNTDGTAYLAAETEVHNRVVQIRDEVMADADPNWRANLRKQVVQAALQATPARAGRTVRNTKTRVFLKPLDPAQVRAIQLHRNGVVHAGNGISRPTLAAIADKGLGTLNFQPGLGRRQVIASITLNQAGLEVAATQNAVAA